MENMHKRLLMFKDSKLARPISAPPLEPATSPLGGGISGGTSPMRPSTSMSHHRPIPRSFDSIADENDKRFETVISSWSAENTTLHWHADLTRKAQEYLPSWIFQRRNLRVLHISSNKLERLPPEMGNLVLLQELVAHDNLLGTIPNEVCSLEQLQRLDLSFNRIRELPPHLKQLGELRELKLGHNMLEQLPGNLTESMKHLLVIDLSFNLLRSLPKKLHRLSKLKILQASYNQITELPSQVRLVEHLELLDISYNRLTELPISELKMMLVESKLKCIECKGNPELLRPPREITEQGGQSVALYLRGSVSGDDELRNTDMVLVVVGDRESGKTSMINAVLSPDNRSTRISNTGGKTAAGIEFRKWEPEELLSFQIVDLGEMSPMVQHLFMVRRAVYVYVWKIQECVDGILPEWEVSRLEAKLCGWLDSLQHRVPGASILFVGTHVDEAHEEDKDWQCALIQRTVRQRLQHHQEAQRSKKTGHDDMSMLRVLNDGESLIVSSLFGDGIDPLRNQIISFTKSTQWYGELIPATYVRLRDKVQNVAAGGEREFLYWKEYQDMAMDCGILDDNSLKIATIFLNDLGVLRHFGDSDHFHTHKSHVSHKQSLRNVVFISLAWIVDVMKALFRRDRSALATFFEYGRDADKTMLLRVKRLLTYGVLHSSLIPFIWPEVTTWRGTDSNVLERYWEHCRALEEEDGQYDRVGPRVAGDTEGLERVICLIEGLDLGATLQETSSHAVTHGERLPIVVPGVLATNYRFKIDARVFGDDCLLRVDIEYFSLPPGFFPRLIIRLRRHASHMDFHTRSAAFYKMGTKLQIFIVPADEDPDKDRTTITALFSSVTLWHRFAVELQAVEKFFPGLTRSGFSHAVANTKEERRSLLVESTKLRGGNLESEHEEDFKADLETIQDPVQVLIVHSPPALSLAKSIQHLIRNLDHEIEVTTLIPDDKEQTLFDARIMLVCIDSHFGNSPGCVYQFTEHAKLQRSVIPLILPGYHISNFASWWPPNMPEMAGYSLFVDLRLDEWNDLDLKSGLKQFYLDKPSLVEQLKFMAHAGDAWAQKELGMVLGAGFDDEKKKREAKAKFLHGEIRKILEEWRGDSVSLPGASFALDRILCLSCLKKNQEDPASFDRAEMAHIRQEWREEILQNRNHGLPAPVCPAVTCSYGHSQTVDAVLSGTVVYESIPCPSCLKNGIKPPWCFNRKECQAYFDQQDSQRVGVMTCPKCMKLGLPAPRVLDILCPEVFLSYQWGSICDYHPDGSPIFSTQKLVKDVRRKIEMRADVLCWLDVEGGLSAGQDHVRQMAEGVEKAFVAVIFLSDAYVNSMNCKREIHCAIEGRKLIIPLLVPKESNGDKNSGWSGPGNDNIFWWRHAEKICKKPHEPVHVSWQGLAFFDPIDLRSLSMDEAVNEITSRVSECFHRGVQIVQRVSRGRKAWKKFQNARMLGRALRQTRKEALDRLAIASPASTPINAAASGKARRVSGEFVFGVDGIKPNAARRQSVELFPPAQLASTDAGRRTSVDDGYRSRPTSQQSQASVSAGSMESYTDMQT